MSTPVATHDFVVTVAVRVRIPVAPDGSWPAPDEAREVVVAGLRGFVFDAPAGHPVTILDAAPSKRGLA